MADETKGKADQPPIVTKVPNLGDYELRQGTIVNALPKTPQSVTQEIVPETPLGTAQPGMTSAAPQSSENSGSD